MLFWALIPLVWRKSTRAGIIALSILLITLVGNAKNAIEGDQNAQAYVLNLVVGIRIVGPAVLSGYLLRKAFNGSA